MENNELLDKKIEELGLLDPDMLIKAIERLKQKRNMSFNSVVEDMLMRSYWTKYKKTMDESLIEGALACNTKQQLEAWLKDYLK